MKVSVIIVNWNGKDLLARNLPHVLRMTYPDYEVIVVDNGSSDGSVELLRASFPAVRVVALPDNRGFTGGNNAALAHARGALVATLNNDARPEPDWLQRLVEASRAHPDAGIFASRILVEGKSTVDTAGDEYRTTFDPLKRKEPVAGEVFSACGGAALYRRSMVDEIGFFDDEFFLVYEDVDLSFRARLAGWSVVSVPDAVVHHQVSTSLGRVPDVHAYYLERNLEFVWLKNMPARLLCKYAAPLLLHRIFGVWEAWRRLRGRFGIYLRAKWNVVTRLGRLLNERRRIQRRRKVSPDAVDRLLVRVPVFSLRYWWDAFRRSLLW